MEVRDFIENSPYQVMVCSEACSGIKRIIRFIPEHFVCYGLEKS